MYVCLIHIVILLNVDLIINIFACYLFHFKHKLNVIMAVCP